MPKMVCRTCGYVRYLEDLEAKVGMVCPECYQQKLRPARPGEEAPKTWHQRLRNETLRALLGAVLGISFGLLFLLIFPSLWNGGFSIRWTGLGLLLFGYGVWSLMNGISLLREDLRRPA